MESRGSGKSLEGSATSAPVGPERLRDKSFLAPLWRDLGLLGLFLAGAGTLLTQAVQIQYLEKDVAKLEKKNESLEEDAREVPGLKKWISCREKEKDFGVSYRFYWATLECVKSPDPKP
jgi:hypothetical protein